MTRAIFIVGVALALFAGQTFAQDNAFKAVLPVLLKVLTYDGNFEAHGSGDFVVLVVSEATETSQRTALLDELKAIKVNLIKTRALRYVGAELKDEAGLVAAIEKSGAAAVLLTPGTSSEGVSAVAKVAQARQLYALALEASMVEKAAIPLGVAIVSGRPQILINEKAAKAISARFETSVLKLAKVIQ